MITVNTYSKRELILSFNKHSYNYLWSTLKNDINPYNRYLDRNYLTEDTVNYIDGSMKLYALVYYHNKLSNRENPGWYLNYEFISKVLHVSVEKTKEYINSLSKAAYILINQVYDEGCICSLNLNNFWVQKAMEFNSKNKFIDIPYKFPLDEEDMKHIRETYKAIKYNFNKFKEMYEQFINTQSELIEELRKTIEEDAN